MYRKDQQAARWMSSPRRDRSLSREEVLPTPFERARDKETGGEHEINERTKQERRRDEKSYEQARGVNCAGCLYLDSQFVGDADDQAPRT